MDEIIEEIINRKLPLNLDVAKVVAINGEVCDVESLTTKKDFFDCRLNAIEQNESDKMIITPELNSTVVIGIFKETEKAIVLKISKVSQIEFVKSTTKFKIDDTGFEIEREGLNLLDVIKEIAINQNRLNQELQKVVVSIGVTPDVASLNTIKTGTEQEISNLIKILV